LKQMLELLFNIAHRVAPRRGAWIETAKRLR